MELYISIMAGFVLSFFLLVSEIVALRRRLAAMVASFRLMFRSGKYLKLLASIFGIFAFLLIQPAIIALLVIWALNNFNPQFSGNLMQELKQSLENGKLLSISLPLFVIAGIGGVSLADTLPHQEAVYQSTIAADGAEHIRIDGGSYFFKPDHVIVKVNVPVELEVSVEKGWIPHTFVIQSPEAGIVVNQRLSSEAKTIRFTPTAVGNYPFYCKNRFLFFKSHREKGMEGVLEVVE